MVVIYKVNDRLSKGIPHKHVVFVDMCYKSQLIENLSGYYSSFSLRSISGSEGWKEFWSPHCRGVWPPLCKKGMDRLMPLIQDFSSISDSGPQKINFTLQSTYTHKHTQKIFLTITLHDLHIHIFSILLFSSITSLNYCFHITNLISWYLMGHELQLGKYSPRPYPICIDTVKSLSEKNGAT